MGDSVASLAVASSQRERGRESWFKTQTDCSKKGIGLSKANTYVAHPARTS